MKKTTKKSVPENKPTQPAVLRVVNPITTKETPLKNLPVRPRDSRLPAPGSIITKNYRGNIIEVKVLENGVEYQPFQDGNGRIGRLILFKECLRNNIVPFIITDNIKMFYYKGLNEWPHNHERLIDTCLSAQDQMKAVLDYFKIKY